MHPFLSNHSFLNGLFIFNPFLFIISLLSCAHFFWSWFITYKRTGCKLDFWHYNVFLTCILPIFILYPFIASELNIPAVGDFYPNIITSTNVAFLISATGYYSMLAGRWFCTLLQSGRRIQLNLNFFELIIYNNLRNRVLIWFVCFFYSFLMLSLILFLMKSGNASDPRSFFLKNGALRPIFNFIQVMYGLVVISLFLRYMNSKNRIDLLLICFISLGSVFLGSRMATLGPFLTMVVIYYFINPEKASFKKIAFISFSFVFLAISLSAFRSGGASHSVIFGLYNAIFFGNNFSDVRDFAWVYSYWDGDFWFGKSYIAAILSFVPREFSDIRSVWAVSVITDGYVGFDPEIHPGLRTGIFGEAYFNFGSLGVIIIGVLSGWYLRLADMKIKEYISFDPRLFFSLIFSFKVISSFYITAGFWALYVFIFFHVCMYVARSFFLPRIQV